MSFKCYLYYKYISIPGNLTVAINIFYMWGCYETVPKQSLRVFYS